MPIRPKSQLDNTAKAFLGQSQQPIEVHQGQHVDEAREDQYNAQREHLLLMEACDYGDDLVRYVTMHRDLSPEEMAWGFCLGLHCARAEYPDGGDAFDDIADQAAKDLMLSVTTVVTDAEAIAQIQTDLPAFTEDAFKRAATFAEQWAHFLGRKKKQLGLGNKQGAYGLGRAFHNLRQTFPKLQGGSAAFDELARRAGLYFAENRSD